MNSVIKIQKIEQEMKETLKSIELLGPCLEGSLKKNTTVKYTKKDGSVSQYPTAPILQYRTGPKKRSSRRIPAAHIEEVQRLLENGKAYRKLAQRYEALSARLALSFKKKSLIPPFPAIRMANLEALLSKVESEATKNTTVDACQLDANVRDAGLKDLANIFGELLSTLATLGCPRTGGTPRETGIDTVLGHVRFTCLYHAPDPGAPVSRQDRRWREREQAKGRRRIKNGTFARMGGAQSAFPFKEELRLLDDMTPALAALHNRVAVFSGSFREGADTLRHLAGVVMSESTFMRRAYAAGKRAEFEQDLEVMRQVVSGTLPFHLAQALIAVVPTLYIMLDGTGVPCVKKDTRGRVGKNGKPAGTREIKVGVIGTFRWKNARGCPVRDPRGETYIATAKKAQSFGAMLRRVANSRGYGGKFRIQICGDGAEWIAKIVEKAFPGKEVIFVNDFYHACEHLHAFLACVCKEKTVPRKLFTKARGILKRCGGRGLVTHLERVYGEAIQDNEDATKELNYFTKRIENMKYPEYREQGLYIGSGIIEATCRTVVARRCKQAGMHWRLKNAAAMCALVARFRSAIPADKPAA